MNKKEKPNVIPFSEASWQIKLLYILISIIYYGMYAASFLAIILAFIWLTKGMALGGVVLVIEGIALLIWWMCCR